ncbi:MAG: hypothetical protein ACYTGV_19790 [Planctomycetota bacterium]|jgi:tetratricopeptide (TPR) repeat protein
MVLTWTYLLDLAWIDHRCREKGMDRLDLAIAVELDALRERVSGKYLRKICAVLECRPEDCSIGWIVPNWSHMADVRLRGTTPADKRLQKRIQDKLRRAHSADMDGMHDTAVRYCREILEELDATKEPEVAGKVRVRMATFLDNGDRLGEALDELDSLRAWLGQLSLGEDGEEISIEAELAWGRVLHRMRHFEAARKVLERILSERGAPYSISAMHQLGVAALGEYYFADPGDGAHRSALLEAAKRYFAEAIKEWSSLDFGYRCGFSHRRLAQVHRILGDYEATRQEYLAAIVMFARFDCYRYLAATRHELDELEHEKTQAGLAELAALLDTLRKH